MGRIANWRIAVKWVAWLILLGPVAEAHPEFAPQAVNRYLKVSAIRPNELRIAYSVLFGAGPALLVRQKADANGDGRLDEKETAALGAEVAAKVARGLEVRIDDRVVQAQFEPPAVGLMGDEVAANALSVDLIARASATGNGPHEARVDDATLFDDLDETEIRIEEAPGTRLTAAWRGARSSADERVTRFVFRGPKFSALEDRSITFDWTAEAVRVEKSRVWWRTGLGLGLGLGLVGFAYYRRRASGGRTGR